MGGFEIFLCVIFGIIGFFVLLLSIPIKVNFCVDEKINLKIRYAFLKFDILPVGPKKEKKPKEKKPKEEKPKEEKPKEEKPKEKKPNTILQTLKSLNRDDVEEILNSLAHVLGVFGSKFCKSFVFDELDIYVNVGSGDAASTAMKYGKICQKIYPAVGYICANNKVKNYDVVIQPDFLARNSEVEVFIDFSITVRKIINSSIGMVFRLIFSVVLKAIKAFSNAKKASEAKSNSEKASQSSSEAA